MAIMIPHVLTLQASNATPWRSMGTSSHRQQLTRSVWGVQSFPQQHKAIQKDFSNWWVSQYILALTPHFLQKNTLPNNFSFYNSAMLLILTPPLSVLYHQTWHFLFCIRNAISLIPTWNSLHFQTSKIAGYYLWKYKDFIKRKCKLFYFKMTTTTKK